MGCKLRALNPEYHFRDLIRKFVKIDWKKVETKRQKRCSRHRATEPKAEIKYLRKLIKKEEVSGQS